MKAFLSSNSTAGKVLCSFDLQTDQVGLRSESQSGAVPAGADRRAMVPVWY